MNKPKQRYNLLKRKYYCGWIHNNKKFVATDKGFEVVNEEYPENTLWFTTQKDYLTWWNKTGRKLI